MYVITETLSRSPWWVRAQTAWGPVYTATLDSALKFPTEQAAKLFIDQTNLGDEWKVMPC